jgi:type I restriction enzyme, S subunit
VISGLKPYPAYKDSGVPWLGQVPEHWGLRRLGASVLGCISGTWGEDPNGRDDILCVRVADFDRTRFRIRLNRPTLRAVSPSDRQHKQLHRDDLLLEKSGGGDLQPVGVVVMYDHDVPAVCSNFVARMPIAPSYDPRYLLYLHAWLYSIRLNLRSVKQTTGIQNLDSRAYLSELVAFPSPGEQVAIAGFLAHADRRILNLVRAKQKLIKLLEEQKQVLVQSAVTRGLDPGIRLVPSGTEWLRDIPEPWEIKPLKALAVIQSGVTLGKQYVGLGVRELPYLRVANVQDGRLDLSEVKRIAVPEAEVARSSLQAGDVLMTEGGDPDKLGRGCVWEGQIEPCLHQNHVFAVRPLAHRLRPHYLAAILSSQYAKDYFLRTAKQTTNLASTNKTTIGQFPVVLPPLEVQDAILCALNADLMRLNLAASNARREVDLLREYRTRLIADVVTGKLDVRSVAASLPEEVDDPDVLTDVSILAEDDGRPLEDDEPAPAEAIT